MPSQTGETSLQHYNCCFSLAHLQCFADSIIYFQNDKINSYLTYATGKFTDNVINLDNINEYIASTLHSFITINDIKGMNKFYFEILSDLTPLSEMKFLELYTAPYICNK